MVRILDKLSSEFNRSFEEFLALRREEGENVDAKVRTILEDVRLHGDAALLSYTEQFDGLDLNVDQLRIREEEVVAACAQIPSEAWEALKIAHTRIWAYHERQKPSDERFTDPIGIELGWQWSPLDSVGLYVPGGTASYPSSVLMNAIPALVAGVERIVMAVPTPKGIISPFVLAAAHLVGIKEIYRIGGAQAIAALAYGTRSIDPVAKIVGPGNIYVAAAKRQVYGHVGIDMIAGPSEVLVIADQNNDPHWIAVDLLAQAEHDEAARSILITESMGFANAVEAAIAVQLRTLPRAEIARASWENFGAILICPELRRDAPALSNRIAPEHLQLAVADPEDFLRSIRNAGAVFLGATTPEAIGDYVAGGNHVLPTTGAARFSSGLSVLDFVKRTSLLKCSLEGLERLAPSAITLAQLEGFDAHLNAVAMRLKGRRRE